VLPEHFYPAITPPTVLNHDDIAQSVTRRRGNCHDNAVAESFFQLLERERLSRRIEIVEECAVTEILCNRKNR
jgi:hypothetical protein